MCVAGNQQTFTVNKGFVTDLASVPRLLWWLFPRDGTYLVAAILHDFLSQISRQQYDGTLKVVSGVVYFQGQSVKPNHVIDPVDVDGIFRMVMRIHGTNPVVYWLMWAAVRWASILEGRKGRKMDGLQWRLLFYVTAGFIAVLAAIVLLLATVLLWLT